MVPAGSVATLPAPLLVRLRTATRALHTQAEHSGVYHALLTGSGERSAYVLLLRNLVPVYCALERALTAPSNQCFRVPADLFRTAALEGDLDSLAGPQWRRELALLPAARAYAGHLDAIAAVAPVRLAAHAYTRYLGDLAGGRILRRLVATRFGLAPEFLTYFDYAGNDDVSALADQLRNVIEAVASTPHAADAVVDEALTAFRQTIAISEAVQQAVRVPPDRGA